MIAYYRLRVKKKYEYILRKKSPNGDTFNYLKLFVVHKLKKNA